MERFNKGDDRLSLEFLFIENDWLHKKYSYLEFVKSTRYLTFKSALNIFLQNNGETIVETGTQRMHNDPGGCSTLLFGAFCAKYDKHLYTVDINPKHIQISKRETREFKDHITYVLMDSVRFLRRFDKPIDLLYLDSLDCPLPPADATLSQRHNLNELKVALKNLRIGSVVLIDDNNFANGGKSRLSKRYLLKSDNWICILDHGQTLWVKVK